MTSVVIMSNDAVLFEMDYETAKMFNYFRTRMTKIKEKKEKCLSEFYVFLDPYLNSKTLKKVVDWAQNHRDDRSTKADDMDSMSAWDKEFFKVDQETLFNILLAAHHLGNERLVNMGCKVVANLITGKTTEEIRKTFNIKNDFSPEEEANLRKKCTRHRHN